MNLLFVNYGDFTTNSLNHIAEFANALVDRGHAVAVAVPFGPETITVIVRPKFRPVTFEEAARTPRLFPDGRGADVIHAWTPREVVRKFVLAYEARSPAPLIVHLEDNEEHLLEAFTGRSLEALRALGPDQLEAMLAEGITHPQRGKNLLRLADRATVIVDTLQQFVPANVPVERLEPGLNWKLFGPRAPREELRQRFGVGTTDKLIVFTGSNTFANEAEMIDLYTAVALLNARGVPTRLLRTGKTAQFQRPISEELRRNVVDAGFVERELLPDLLALADVLVQPGRPGEFNDYRLPSKIPEFLATGRPVVLPASNIGRSLRDGIDALILRRGDPEEIADACARIFADADLARTLGENGSAFARARFDLAGAVDRLERLYQETAAGPPRAAWGRFGRAGHNDAALLTQLALDRTPVDAELLEDALRQADFFEAEHALLLQRRTKEWQELKTKAELTRQHASNLESLLAAAREENVATKRHAQNLERLLQAARGEIEQLREQGARLCADLEGTREHLAEQIRTLETAQRQHRELDERLSAKIRRMQSTFSGRATAPLRALRRATYDRWKKHAAPLAGQVQVAPPNLLAIVDTPDRWDAAPVQGAFTGWCIDLEGHPVRAIRAMADGRILAGRYGIRRDDVVAAHAFNSESAALCGFEIRYSFSADIDVIIQLEAQLADDRWVTWFTGTLHTSSFPRSARDYTAWVEAFGRLKPAQRDALRARIEALPTAQRPLFSVLMPVFNPPERWLQRAIESVREQIYDRWELCIADDASTDPGVRRVLEKFRALDPRIRLEWRSENGHISRASNSALELARGEFIALLDHDDELAPDALAEMALALARQPDADVLYSDEDKIDEQGRRYGAYFKPDFLPDLLTGQNCLSHLSVFRTALVRQVGGFRVDFEGSQDWDLALRVTEQTTPARVVHVPKVLYHWRAIGGSTAMEVGQKAYSLDAARRALVDHFARRGVTVDVRPVPGSHWRVVRPLPERPPLVTVIIPTKDNAALLRQCVASVYSKTDYAPFELLIVDNLSVEPAALALLDELARRPRIRVERHPQPFNFSALNNFAVRRARGELLCLLNNDIEPLHRDWLREMVSHAVRPEIGAVGAMLYYPDETIQHAGIVLGLGGVANHAFVRHERGSDGYFNRGRLVQNYSAVTAACLVIRKSIYEQVGGFNEQDLPIAFNDVDFCLRVRAAGYLNLWTPFAELTHRESASRGREDTPEKRARFDREVAYMRRTWGEQLDRDPAYNPNLALSMTGFDLAWPPRTSL